MFRNKRHSSDSMSSLSSQTSASCASQTDTFMSRRPASWNSAQVSQWLASIGLGKYSTVFHDNAITGAQLPSLTENELLQLEMKDSADRASYLLAIQRLRLEEVHNVDSDTGSSHSHSSLPSATNSATSSAASALASEVRIKFVPHSKADGAVQVISVALNITYSQLKRKIKTLYGHRFHLAYKDSEGDTLYIRSDDALHAAIAEAFPRVLRISIKRSRTRNAMGADETYVLEAILDGVVVTDGAGTIEFVNKALESTLGYKREELLGKNVKVLTPRNVAPHHDEYLSNFIKTGQSKLIGVGRDVLALTKGGEEIPVRLNVNHRMRSRSSSKKLAASNHVFTATLSRHVNTMETVSSALNFTFLESLLAGAIVINEKGIILYVNNMIQTMLGYEHGELVTRNVSAIMTGQDKAKHDEYIAAYVNTGVAKIIGTPFRRVVAACKDGRLVAVRLSLSVQVLGGNRYFTGIINLDTNDNQNDSSFLQMQRDLIETLPVGAILTDEAGLIQGFNPTALRMFGYELIDVVGKNVSILCPADIARHHDAFLRHYLTTGKSRILGMTRDLAAVKKGGEVFNIKLSTTEKRNGDKRIFIAIIQ